MDNRGYPEDYELPADEYSGWTVLAKLVAGITLGTIAFIGAVILALAGA